MPTGSSAKKDKDKDKEIGKPWRIQAESSDGVTVTLGRYETKESAEQDYSRILQDGFYRKLKLVSMGPEVAPKTEPAAKPTKIRPKRDSSGPSEAPAPEEGVNLDAGADEELGGDDPAIAE